MTLPAPTGIVPTTAPEAAAVQRSTLVHLTVDELKHQLREIQLLQTEVMQRGEDYDVIPGVKGRDGKPPKPSLMNPGAEKLCLLFGLAPRYEVQERYEEQPDGTRHLTAFTKCFLYTTATGQLRGEGVGLCTTKESKYAWRGGGRACPSCQSDAIGRSRHTYEGTSEKGWWCNHFKGGCGNEFHPRDERITRQQTGRKPNPDIADCYNTVIKMSMKRAFVGATRTATAAGHLFSQDMEPGDGAGADSGRYDGDGPAGDGDDRFEDGPNVSAFYDQIEAAPDTAALNLVGAAIMAANIHPQDREELRAAFGARVKVLKSKQDNGQKATLDRIAAQAPKP